MCVRVRESSRRDAHETRTRRGFTIDFSFIMLFLWISRELYTLQRESCERERSHRDAILTTHETRTRRGLDFTIYKVLIIMFMADLCYIFIYIIKWFLKSPVCFRNHTKYENNFNWNMPTVFHMMKKSIFRFLKKKHLKTIRPSQITVNIGHCMSMKLLVICSAFSMLISQGILY